MAEAENKKQLKEIKEVLRGEIRFTQGLIDQIKVLKGWKQIKDFCGLECSNRTMKELSEKSCLPVYYENGRPRVAKFVVELWMINIQKFAFRGKERVELERLEKDFFVKMAQKQKFADQELKVFEGRQLLSG